jgi:hypothetical protein
MLLAERWRARESRPVCRRPGGCRSGAGLLFAAVLALSVGACNRGQPPHSVVPRAPESGTDVSVGLLTEAHAPPALTEAVRRFHAAVLRADYRALWDMESPYTKTQVSFDVYKNLYPPPLRFVRAEVLHIDEHRPDFWKLLVRWDKASALKKPPQSQMAQKDYTQVVEAWVRGENGTWRHRTYSLLVPG